MSSRASRVQRRKKTHSILFSLGFFATAFIFVCTVGVIGVVKLCDSWLVDLPDYSSADAFNLAEPTKIYAADGETLLAALYLENREPVSYDEVSPYVFQATVCTEDERFYKHHGVDYRGIIRAFWNNMRSGATSEGASTITQQFIRNTILIDEMNDITLRRKVREAYLAIQVERMYSKEDILMMYLNTINYGDGAYGIQAASQNYFSKDASDLTLSEAALLAGLPQAPSRLNPFNNYEAAIARRNTVLRRMLRNEAITQEQYDEALAETIVLEKKDMGNNGVFQQPYFVDFVKRQLLEDYTVNEIFKGGWTVYTTLDMNLQAAAEWSCYRALEGQADDLEVALCSVDPDTGYIVAMFGGKDYYSDQYNLATQAHRQCGSSFKMFTLTCAVEEGMSPGTMFNGSSPMTINGWTVANASSGNYGSISLEAATWYSLNTVYAQLIDQLGPSKVVDVAHRMGITSPLGNHDAITLGTEGVTCLEMASAFGTLATGGTHVEPICITKIVDRNGNVIYEA
ncbi:MAG: transglycosylase domain-containing protein, partial [Coriobacteriales bacterium]|nr:transglycosylase domain-containing protein [Coriobacteriales bacterium]